MCLRVYSFLLFDLHIKLLTSNELLGKSTMRDHAISDDVSNRCNKQAGYEETSSGPEVIKLFYAQLN